MSDGTPRTSQPAVAAIYPTGAYVTEPRRGHRVARVVRAWDECPPVLYKLAGATDERPWFAWERDLRPATAAEAAVYKTQRHNRRQ